MSAPLPGLITAPAAARPSRVAALDTLRGTLLVLIVVTHGFGLLAAATMSHAAWETAEIVFGVATPSFVLISGTLFGFFLATRRNLTPVFRGYRRRALLFVGFAHLVLALELYPVFAVRGTTFWSFYLSRWYITDTLGVAFLVMPALLPSLRPHYRAILGVLLLIASRMDVVFPWATSPGTLLVHQVLFGRLVAGPRLGFDCYPLIPIIGSFMVGSFIGDRLAAGINGAFDRFVGNLQRLVAPLLLLSLLLCGVWALLAFRLRGHQMLQALFFPDRTFTLFPGYLAWYLAALAFFLKHGDRPEGVGGLSRWLALLGRRSLFVFVAQYCVVQTLPAILGHRYMSLRGLLLFLPLAVVAVFGAAVAWDWVRRPQAATR